MTATTLVAPQPSHSPAVQRADDAISGSIIALYFVAAILLIRFHRKTRDRLFILFGSAFAILGIDQIMFHLTHENDEARTYLYIIRLAAFLLIIYAIIDKNLARKPRSTPRSSPS